MSVSEGAARQNKGAFQGPPITPAYHLTGSEAPPDVPDRRGHAVA